MSENNIRIENFDLGFDGVPLLKNATLVVNDGRKYGIVAPNGHGKSTLLKKIATREDDFQKIPAHLDIWYVEQEVEGEEISALESVINADKERLELLAEEKRLEQSEEAEDFERLMEVLDRLEAIEAYSAEGRASAILSGLQFDDDMKAKHTKDFSGGWRMRIAFARALFCRPTLLMLDEPTNHLDLYATIWLETYLKRWKKSLILVSHDQDFLNCICDEIIHIHEMGLHYYRPRVADKGAYDHFKEVYAEELRIRWKDYEKQCKIVKEQQRKQNLTAKEKEREQGKKGGPKGGKKGKRGDSDDDGPLGKLQLPPMPPREYNVEFHFPDPGPIGRPIIQVHDAGFEYNAKQGLLFSKLEFGLDLDSRIALVGRNGAGKTTLLRVLAGELTAVEGEVIINRHLIIGRFNQHFIDKLDVKKSPVDYLQHLYPEATPVEIRNMLGRFNLPGQAHCRPIGAISGGQKSRVSLAEIGMRHPHILFLDEPTNHLDIESIQALVDALKEYKGGLVLVSHDGRLIRTSCKEIWVVGDGKVEPYEGDFDSYKEDLIEEFEEKQREEEEMRARVLDERRKARQELEAKKQAALEAKGKKVVVKKKVVKPPVAPEETAEEANAKKAAGRDKLMDFFAAKSKPKTKTKDAGEGDEQKPKKKVESKSMEFDEEETPSPKAAKSKQKDEGEEKKTKSRKKEASDSDEPKAKAKTKDEKAASPKAKAKKAKDSDEPKPKAKSKKDDGEAPKKAKAKDEEGKKEKKEKKEAKEPKQKKDKKAEDAEKKSEEAPKKPKAKKEPKFDDDVAEAPKPKAKSKGDEDGEKKTKAKDEKPKPKAKPSDSDSSDSEEAAPKAKPKAKAAEEKPKPKAKAKKVTESDSDSSSSSDVPKPKAKAKAKKVTESDSSSDDPKPKAKAKAKGTEDKPKPKAKAKASESDSGSEEKSKPKPKPKAKAKKVSSSSSSDSSSESSSEEEKPKKKAAPKPKAK